MTEQIDVSVEQTFDTTPLSIASQRPVLTLSEAAQACSVSRSKVRRSLDAGQFANALRDDGPDGPATGQWRVPVTDLLAAGYVLNRAQTVQEPIVTHVTDTGPDTLSERTVRAELDRDRWQAIAEERRAALDDLRHAMRMIEAGPMRLTTEQVDRVSRHGLVIAVMSMMVVALVAAGAVLLMH